MNDRQHQILMNIGFYMGKLIEPLSDREKVEVWAQIAHWCEGDIEGSGFRMNYDGHWYRAEDDE